MDGSGESSPCRGRGSVSYGAAILLSVLFAPFFVTPACASLTVNGKIVDEDMFLEELTESTSSDSSQAADGQAIPLRPLARQATILTIVGSLLSVVLLAAVVLVNRRSSPPVDPAEAKRRIIEEQRRITEEQHLWESRNSRAVCGLSGVRRVRSLIESKAERAALAEVKKEIRQSVVVPEGSGFAVSDEEDQEQINSVFQMLRGISPFEEPYIFTVEYLKSVSKHGDEAELTDVLMKVVRVLEVVQFSVILEVRAADARIHQRLGPLAMKVWISSCPADSAQDEILDAHTATVKLIERDASAINRLGGRGKSPAEFCATLGIQTTQYTALLKKRGTFCRMRESTLVLSPHVTFAPLFLGDMVDLLEEAPQLSMEARAYIASRAVLAAAHLNVRGFSHGDLRVANIGLNFHGEAILFDFESLDRLGTPRSGISKYNLAPECIEQVCRGEWPVNTLEVDSWAAGVALYRIFTGANPFGENPNFFDSLLDPKKAAEAVKMEGIRSPAFTLREYGVPRIWEEIIVLLLQSDPETRPSLPQILEAYPEISNFAGV